MRHACAAVMFTVVASCAGRSSPPPQTPFATAPAAVARSTPAPSIAWGDRRFETPGLPAIAHAAEVAVVAIRDTDGARGFPNLRVEVRDRSDRTIQTIAVMDANEYEKLVVDGRPGAELDRRIAAANSELARLHGLHDLAAMQPLELQKPTDGLPHLAIGDGLDVDWANPYLKVFRHNVDRPFRVVDGKQWLASPGTRCSQCPPCDNPAFLEAAYKTTDVSAVVVEIGYRGTDSCYEPGNQLHVITW